MPDKKPKEAVKKPYDSLPKCDTPGCTGRIGTSEYEVVGGKTITKACDSCGTTKSEKQSRE